MLRRKNKPAFAMVVSFDLSWAAGEGGGRGPARGRRGARAGRKWREHQPQHVSNKNGHSGHKLPILALLKLIFYVGIKTSVLVLLGCGQAAATFISVGT